MRLIKWILLAGVGVAVYAWWPRELRHPPGVLVKSEPNQKAMAALRLPEVEGWKLTGLAKYGIEARVLGTKRYFSGASADLVPVDVALGWNRMSDQSVLDQFTISMSNRFFFYEWSDSPAIPPTEIVRSASNNHIISANPDVAKLVRSLNRGQIVQMIGYLVNAQGPNGQTWNSSTTRNDTGNGACELFYVIEAKTVVRP